MLLYNTIAATNLYKEGKESNDKAAEEQKKNGQLFTTVNSNGGNTLWGGVIGFTFDKINKAANFFEQVGAPVAFLFCFYAL